MATTRSRNFPPKLTIAAWWTRLHTTELELIGEVRYRIDASLRKEMKTLTEEYRKLEQMAGVHDSAFDWYYDEGHIRQTLIPETLAISFTTTYWSHLEHALVGLCSAIKHEKQHTKKLKKLPQMSLVESGIVYAETVGGFQFDRQSPVWAEIEFYRALRNFLVHEGKTTAPKDLAEAIKHRSDISLDLNGNVEFGEDFLDNMQAAVIALIGLIGAKVPF